jgi:pimeloyl-ACP methyl ester carboxylesterase
MHIDGQHIHARWLAPDTDRLAVVLLHEGLGSVAGWDRSGFAEALASEAGRGVFAFDRCGYGESQPRRDPWRLDFLKEEALTWLPAVLDAASIDRAVLYGHIEPLTMAGIRTAREAYAEPGSRLRRSLQNTQGTCADALFEAWSRIWLDPLFTGCDIRESLDALSVPCLVIQGDQDPYGTEIHLREVVARSRGPVTTWLLDGVGHAPHREGDRLAERVARFIDEVSDG